MNTWLLACTLVRERTPGPIVSCRSVEVSIPHARMSTGRVARFRISEPACLIPVISQAQNWRVSLSVLECADCRFIGCTECSACHLSQVCKSLASWDKSNCQHYDGPISYVMSWSRWSLDTVLFPYRMTPTYVMIYI